MSIQRIKPTKGTLSEKAYKEIKQAILSLDIAPGSMLLEDELSKKLGISRTPIRSAMQKLSHENLVNLGAKGAYVTELSATAFLEIYDIRESLELLCVKNAALNRTDEEVSRMEELMQVQESMTKELEPREFLDKDRKLHLMFAKSSRNHLLKKYLMQINESFNRYLYFTEFEYRATNVVHEHHQLVDAIKHRDSYRSQQIMEVHLRGVKESIILALLGAK